VAMIAEERVPRPGAPQRPGHTLAELAAYDKANPANSPLPLTAEKLRHDGCVANKVAASNILAVALRGDAAGILDTLAGGRSSSFSDTVRRPAHRSGELRRSAAASPAHPRYENVPAIAENLPRVRADRWFALVAPAGTPAEYPARQREMEESSKDAETVKGGSRPGLLQPRRRDAGVGSPNSPAEHASGGAS